MATLDATGILPTSSVGSQQGQSQPQANWDDVDDADEIPVGELNGGPEEDQPAASEEWNLDDGWKTNIPITSPLVGIPGTHSRTSGHAPENIEAVSALVDEMNRPGKRGESADVSETSLLADSDPEAVTVSTVEVAASDEVATDPQPAGDSQPSAGTGEPVEETTDDILALIVEAERKCERTGATVIGLTARLKEAKENDKAAQNELRELIREVGMDFTRPMVAKPAAATVPANALAGPPEDEDESEDEDDEDLSDDATDLEDSGSEESEAPAGPVMQHRPDKIRITTADPNYPQLAVGSVYTAIDYEEGGDEGVVTIIDPINDKEEILLSTEEYEAISWGDFPVAIRVTDNAAAVAGKIDAGPNSAAASQAKANEKNSRPEDDSWRKASLLDDVGLPPNLAALLEANPEKTLKTMGDVQDWTSKGNNLSDIPKIGPAKVTQLEDAFEKFWARWNAKK